MTNDLQLGTCAKIAITSLLILLVVSRFYG